MVVRIVEFLEGALEVGEHLLDLFLSPPIFPLEIIDGVLATAQDRFERICFINFLHLCLPS